MINKFELSIESVNAELAAVIEEKDKPRRTKAEVLHYLTRLCSAAHQTAMMQEYLYNKPRPTEPQKKSDRREALKMYPDGLLGLTVMIADALDELTAM